MAKNSVADLLSVGSLFTTQAERDEAQRETVRDIPLEEISDFPNHPFKVRMDESMMEMVDSVKQYGVLVPALVRPKPDGGYEMIAGHRRRKASELAEKQTLSCIVRDMTDDTATEGVPQQTEPAKPTAPEPEPTAPPQPTEPPKPTGPAPTEPSPTEPTPTAPIPTESQPTEPAGCTHNWQCVHHDEEGHWLAGIICDCGWTVYGSPDEVSAAWNAHSASFPPEESLFDHGGFGCVDEWVVDAPAYEEWYCSLCGEAKP